MTVVLDSLSGVVITSSILIIVVFGLRFLLRNSAKKFAYYLWILVLLKLMVPVTFEFSTENANLSSISGSLTIIEDVTKSIVNVATPKEESNSVEKPIVNNPEEVTSPIVNQSSEPVNYFFLIWLGGAFALTIHSVISYVIFKRSLNGALKITDNVYEDQSINTAFILGVFKPKIYLPKGLDENDRAHILKHEGVHQSRKDYILKPLFYLVTIVYWFNPLVWLSYSMFIKDMEMSCDEIATKEYKVKEKKDYSFTLLNVAANNSGLSIPLAFSENSTKSRVKNILKSKKTKPTLIVSVAIICMIAVLVSTFNFLPRNQQRQFDLYNYKTEYVGDNSKVGTILNNLFTDDLAYDTFELKTDKAPYGIIVNMKNSINDLTEQQHNKVNLNISIMFSLIGNVENITLKHSDGSKVSISRTKCINEVGNDYFKSIKSEEEFADLISKFLLKYSDDENEILYYYKNKTILESDVDQVSNILFENVYVASVNGETEKNIYLSIRDDLSSSDEAKYNEVINNLYIMLTLFKEAQGVYVNFDNQKVLELDRGYFLEVLGEDKFDTIKSFEDFEEFIVNISNYTNHNPADLCLVEGKMLVSSKIFSDISGIVISWEYPYPTCKNYVDEIELRITSPANEKNFDKAVIAPYSSNHLFISYYENGDSNNTEALRLFEDGVKYLVNVTVTHQMLNGKSSSITEELNFEDTGYSSMQVIGRDPSILNSINGYEIVEHDNVRLSQDETSIEVLNSSNKVLYSVPISKYCRYWEAIENGRFASEKNEFSKNAMTNNQVNTYIVRHGEVVTMIEGILE